ncbi:unnamed protein product [Vitrella brassicaformis CCMP3155]|uniref:Uncharacterized protein n=1 Tax=Vitrella brassicaformis (strain CCMP3155) TaxID=1169540 RepID=A0A0G4GTN9_VITBC|nr:unnamed protein product [Vitrella brassicaformis CCMP3155]|eukprot:CEM34136.1 unnamed protein product [Vitrella brassicaformis CCMP3155]
MDLLNRVEARGLTTWLVSIMLLSVIIHGETNDYISAILLLLAMMLSLYHYLILLSLICHNGLCDLAETKGEPSTPSPARRTTFGDGLLATLPIWRPAAACLSRLLAWHTRRAEKQREKCGKVCLDWESGKLSWTGDGGDKTLWHGRSSEWRLARRSALISRMLSAAVEEAIDRLQIRDVPLDFLDFLLCWAFYLNSPYMREQCRLRWESTVSSDRRSQVRRRNTRGGSQDHPTNNGLRRDSTEQETQIDERAFIDAGRFVQECQRQGRVGMTLHDLQSKLLLVVDELVTHQHDYDESVCRRARTRQHVRSVSGAILITQYSSSSEFQVDAHVGGWRQLYKTYEKAKQRMRHARSQAGNGPDDDDSEPPTDVHGHGQDEDAQLREPVDGERVLAVDVSCVNGSEPAERRVEASMDEDM